MTARMPEWGGFVLVGSGSWACINSWPVARQSLPHAGAGGSKKAGLFGLRIRSFGLRRDVDGSSGQKSLPGLGPIPGRMPRVEG